MWRSATIHGRSASGSTRRPAGRDRLRPASERCRPSSWPRRRSNDWPSASARARAPLALPEVAVLGEPRHGCGGELRLLPTPARRRDRAPGRLASSRIRGEPVDPGTKIAARRRSAARAVPLARRPHVTRPARSRGIAGRPTSGVVRRSTASQPGSSRSARTTPRGTARSFGRSSTTIRFRLAAGANSSSDDAGRDEPVVAGEPLGRRLADRLREREQRVDPGEQLLALRARGRIAEPVGRAERRDGERVGLAQREVGERGQPRLEAVDEVEAAAARARAAGLARTPTGTPICERREIGTAGPTATTSCGRACPWTTGARRAGRPRGSTARAR